MQIFYSIIFSFYLNLNITNIINTYNNYCTTLSKHVFQFCILFLIRMRQTIMASFDVLSISLNDGFPAQLMQFAYYKKLSR